MLLVNKSRLTAISFAALATISASGHAQQIALLDSGVDPNAGLNISGGFNYFNNTDDTSDVSDREGEGHGTVSARVASEAFSGIIAPYVVTDGQRDLLFENQVRIARDNALSDILGRNAIRAVGITWGTPGVTGASSSLLPSLSNAGKFVAIMSGNDFQSQPNALASASFNLQGVLVVGGTDANGNLLPQVNRAGRAANRFVAANGLPEDGAELGGSSWATARITGIAGAVFQQNPDLTAEQVVDVILRSAEDRGDPGTDQVYGRGVILSAEQVLNNLIGPPEVPPPSTNNGGGGGGGGGGAALLIGGALAGALLLTRKPKDKLEKTLVLDSYGRAFQVDLNPHIAVRDESFNLDGFFLSLDQSRVNDGFVLPDLNTEVAVSAITRPQARVDMIEYFAMPDDRVIHDKPAEFSLALRTQLSQSLSLDSGYQVEADTSFGGVSQLTSHQDFGRSSFISGQSFGSLLSGFGAQSNMMSLDYAPKLGGASHKASFGLGLVSTKEDQRFGLDSFSSILKAGYQFTDNAGLSLQFGQLEEQGSILGGAAGGTFGVESATTYAINLSGHIKASDKISVVANYGVGKTKVDASEDSLLSGFSNLRSDWYSVGVVGNDVFRDKDQFGLAFSQPLKIRSGHVDYSLPVSRNQNGIVFDQERVNLADTGATERSVEGYYRTKISGKFELGGFAQYRQNPNHVVEQGDDWMVMATLRYRR